MNLFSKIPNQIDVNEIPQNYRLSLFMRRWGLWDHFWDPTKQDGIFKKNKKKVYKSTKSLEEYAET